MIDFPISRLLGRLLFLFDRNRFDAGLVIPVSDGNLMPWPAATFVRNGRRFPLFGEGTVQTPKFNRARTRHAPDISLGLSLSLSLSFPPMIQSTCVISPLVGYYLEASSGTRHMLLPRASRQLPNSLAVKRQIFQTSDNGVARSE